MGKKGIKQNKWRERQKDGGRWIESGLEVKEVAKRQDKNGGKIKENDNRVAHPAQQV